MNNLPLVDEAVGAWCRPYALENYVVVPTYHLYPSNSCVQIFIEGGQDNFVVSDGGGALQTALGLGRGLLDPRKHLRSAAREASAHVNGAGWIFAKNVEANALTSFVSIIAECSKSAALSCARHFRPDAKIDFKNELDSELVSIFQKRLERKIDLVGASNKHHRFDFCIKGSHNEIIVIDAVSPDARSINSIIGLHLDLKNANNQNVGQRIIYDDRIEWKSSDLSLLNVGATPLAFTRAMEKLERLAILRPM